MSNLNPGGLTRVLNYIKTWVTGLLNSKANSSHSHTKSQITDFPSIPSKTSQLTNDSGYLTSHQSLSNYVTLNSAQTITATKTISANLNFSTTYTRGTAPSSSELEKALIDYKDSAGNRICLFSSTVFSDKSSLNAIWAYNTSIASGYNIGYIGIGSRADGSVFTIAPTPGASDNSTQIATTAWVTSKGYITSSGSCHYANSAGAVAWDNVSGKPSTFTPSSHTHDDRYYTESEINTKLSSKSDTSHNHNSTYLGISAKAESAKVADYAKLLAYSHTNEINFKGGRQATCYFNYRNADDDSTGTAATVEYKFCNYGGDSVSNVTVSAGTFKENGSSLADKYQAKGSYASSAGDTITGTLNLSTENNVCLNLRPGNRDYYDTISVQTAGNEAVVFATKNSVTSWMFINGEDSVTNHDTSRWKSLTPGLQIKSNKVAIGKLIGDGANLTYPLEVNGTMSASSVVVTNNSSNGVLFGSYRVYVG